MGQDSKVSIGSGCHGRSGSWALDRTLLKEAPLLLGKNIHLSCFHMPTWAIRADDVSREQVPRLPRVPLPMWLRRAAAKGEVELGKELAQLSGSTRALCRWVLLGGASYSG